MSEEADAPVGLAYIRFKAKWEPGLSDRNLWAWFAGKGQGAVVTWGRCVRVGATNGAAGEESKED